MVIVIAAILFAAGGAHFGAGSSTGSVGTAPVPLPTTLGGFRDYATVLAQHTKRNPHDQKAVNQDRANQLKIARLTETAYRRAYGGAAVGYRTYSDRSLTHVVGVIAIRASSPRLTDGPVIDPASEGLAVAQTRVVEVGSVSCVVFAEQLTPAGSPIKPSSEVIQQCQRTGQGLTVEIYGGDETGDRGRQTMVAATDAAWAAASKS